MPELPEVETVVRDLRPLLAGRRVVAVRVGKFRLRRPWKKAWAGKLVGAAVGGIRRRGKWIVIDLVPLSPLGRGVRGEGKGSTGRKPRPTTAGADPSPPAPLPSGERGAGGPRLVVHLGMTGQFTVAPAADPAPDHLHVVFDLDDGRQLRFRDPRRFGSVELFPDEPTVQAFLAARLGPEPTDLDPAAFHRAVTATGRALKAVLLDQKVAAGVGNIYADEALHRAGLHPERRGRTLTPAESARLAAMIRAVVAEAIVKRGSTIRDYVGGSGLRGAFQDEFRVYGRPGEACPACAAAIEVVRVVGRSSHYCPACQEISPQRARRAQRTTAGQESEE